MNVFKTIAAIVIAVVLQANATAQNTHPLIGKWSAKYEENGEKMYMTQEFREENGKIICYTTYIKDSEDVGEAYESVVLQNIEFKKNRGKGDYKYTYEGENYEVRAKLELEGNDTLKISYSAWGYSDTETWKRQK